VPNPQVANVYEHVRTTQRTQFLVMLLDMLKMGEVGCSVCLLSVLTRMVSGGPQEHVVVHQSCHAEQWKMSKKPHLSLRPGVFRLGCFNLLGRPWWQILPDGSIHQPCAVPHELGDASVCS